jgi:hypothetical protein
MTPSMRLWRAIKYLATRFGWFALGFLTNLGMAIYASKGSGRAKLMAEASGNRPVNLSQFPDKDRFQAMEVRTGRFYSGAGELDD